MLSPKLPQLIGEQCRILYLPEDSNQVVLGVAGSGKSVEAAYRAIWISKRYPNEKVLVLSVNKDVNDVLMKTIEKYPDTDNVEVNTIYSYFKKIVDNYLQPDDNLSNLLVKYRKDRSTDEIDLQEIISNLSAIRVQDDKKLIKDLIAEERQKFPDSTLWSKDDVDTFIEDEIYWMQENYVKNKDEYLSITRVGRGNQRISKQQRETMFEIFKDYNMKRMKENKKFFNFNDIYSLAIKYCQIPEEERPKYIIIDEVQDISPVMFKALSKIIKSDGLWSVFGDTSQNIFGQRISWASLGLDNIRKQYRLERNYRNTKQIGELAKAMLDTDLFEKDDNFIEPSTSAFEGEKPYLCHLVDDNYNGLISALKLSLENHESTAVILMNPRDEKVPLIKLLADNDIHWTSNIDDYDPENDLFVDNINRIKGLEFDTVYVLCIDDIQPNMDLSREEYDDIYANPDNQRILAKTIYVAATRARKKLVLIYKNNPLDFILKSDLITTVGR